MKFFTCSIIMSVFLQLSSPNPLGFWTLLPNILVVEVNGALGQQPLSCLGSPQDGSRKDNKSQDIIWKKNGVVEEQRGNSYSVELEESKGGGNYTCHREDGSLVNHTVVLIQEKETESRKIVEKINQGDYVQCLAQNYNGEFHCSWTWHRSRDAKVAFIEVWRGSNDGDTQCSLDTSTQRWTCSSGQSNFSCSVDEHGHGISCRDEQHCPYAEESKRIFVAVYMLTEDFLVENYSQQFYLAEIVKPDMVKISEVNTTMIEWSYPSSWSSPYSYFPLTFEIAQLRQGCKQCGNPCKRRETWTVQSPDILQITFKNRPKAVCVRAKDALCDSQWSEWSHLRLRGNEKKKTLAIR
ncbi:interleukin 12Ba [Pleuronectes platessa]|uniref:interleukin 12Ba n=1 Tax=Pleuronectes platessa TaxID=8262 RepID=UPI00232A2BC8|nr:interleukin 12Ba [Pleuronectes platessa]XP_053284755.1 interleukin 12Ba [Pleuronectes platessa]